MALRYAGEWIGSTMMILMAFALLLATRSRVLERFFGGLDRMYALHRQAGTWIFLLLLLHFLVMPLNPDQVPPGRAPGYIAFGGFILLILLSLAPRIPIIRRIIRLGYRGWRISHKFIGVFFIMGTAHAMLVDPLVRSASVPFGLLLAAMGVGIVSYLYTELIARFVRRRAIYKVAEVRRLGEGAIEAVLAPETGRMSFEAGQFLFIRFKGNRALSEWHPFTVCSSPRESSLRLAIRAAGDYTGYLQNYLMPGTRAVVEGGYGKMDYRRGGKDQIWIAGGIGITPFLSWIRDMPHRLEYRIDFFYTVRTPEEAFFLSEILEAVRRHPHFKLHMHYSAEKGRLSVERLADELKGGLAGKSVYMCGPAPMLAAFKRDFRRRGVPAASVRYERFHFR
ncbi:ferric reductase-like transmembrane domain-containing protein [Cohnella xylanilytica]|uniref:Ferric reductase-like transmembrane domain-containing protein n=2 Tax=Cohnella xylanilytica TaxID=557555 RepID=A0A841TY77_9BACL|nr:ferric reductase-like transmembrane domain-containing protein [Cohnella xylanilytica]